MATCAIDVNPPTSRPHVALNAKGLQLEREKQERIMRENFILLKKLGEIMYRKRATVESDCRLKWGESSISMEEEGEDRGEAGEAEEYPTPESSSIFEDTSRALTQSEAGECLHALGKCDSGLGYAYLGLNASNKDLTDVRIVPTFKYVLYVDVSGNRLTNEALRVLCSMKYLLMLRADRNQAESAELEPMPYLQVLTLNRNKLTSTLGISHKLLECLELSHNNIEEVILNPYNLENLRTLELRGNILTTTNGIYFPGLTRLYLAENQIETLEGLEILVNLRILHLRSNRVSNLDGFDSRCDKLNYLNLRNNEIRRISELEKLDCLASLETLIILENPVAGEAEGEEEVAYRRYVLAMLPNLKRIDKDPVLFEERREAKEFRRQMLRDGKTFADLDLNLSRAE
ncbi:leucine-rich repeat-containing protein 23 [Xylocopa sonorina]|uniref:leucine-rich repeat-containing protein 23 n=1 Tax=Xylocopa sonorina TaxID=1818115 RepID=UPI00403ABCC8